MAVSILDPNRFDALADIDTDGAVFQVGVQHFAIGPPAPAIFISTGALELKFTAHISDIDNIIDALKEARKELKRLVKPARNARS